jgi:hypothetical protein
VSEEFLNDPYKAQSPPAESDTLPLDEIIRQAISAAMLDMHTWLPAQVTKVLSTGFVNVQPLLKRTYSDGTTVSLPELQNVMIAVPSGADWWIKPPVAVGDTGIALFCERSLDIWQVSGGNVDPEDPRHHDLSDAVFIPGLRPADDVFPSADPNGLPYNADDMILRNGNAQMILQAIGHFRISNLNGGVELLSALVSLLTTLIAAQVPTGIGPQNFLPGTISDLTATLGDLNNLKGS